MKNHDGWIFYTQWSHTNLLFNKCASITNCFIKSECLDAKWISYNVLMLFSVFNLMHKNKRSCCHICECLAAAETNMYDGRKLSDCINLNVSCGHGDGLRCLWCSEERVKLFPSLPVVSFPTKANQKSLPAFLFTNSPSSSPHLYGPYSFPLQFFPLSALPSLNAFLLLPTFPSPLLLWTKPWKSFFFLALLLECITDGSDDEACYDE